MRCTLATFRFSVGHSLQDTVKNYCIPVTGVLGSVRECCVAQVTLIFDFGPGRTVAKQ